MRTSDSCVPFAGRAPREATAEAMAARVAVVVPEAQPRDGVEGERGAEGPPLPRPPRRRRRPADPAAEEGVPPPIRAETADPAFTPKSPNSQPLIRLQAELGRDCGLGVLALAATVTGTRGPFGLGAKTGGGAPTGRAPEVGKSLYGSLGPVEVGSERSRGPSLRGRSPRPPPSRRAPSRRPSPRPERSLRYSSAPGKDGPTRGNVP